MKQGPVPHFFLFFKKTLKKLKQVVRSLVSICFGSSRLGPRIKLNCIKLQTVHPEVCSILIF